MTISSSVSRVNYTGNNATATYTFPFRIIAASDLLVTKQDNVGGAPVTLALSTDYTVPAASVGSFSGGSITLTAGNLPTGYKLVIRRVRPILQNTDIRNQGDYYPETIEDALDDLVRIHQQQQDAIDRSMKLPETISGADFNATLPASIATPKASVVVNNTGDGFAPGPTSDQIAAAQTNATNAATSASGAATSATAAAGSATAAAGSASAAATSATAASTSASGASSSQTAAASSATAAAGSATAAAGSATSAGTSATSATGSATTASTGATNAGNSATAAATSATNASTSATAAAGSATAAAGSATAAAASAAAIPSPNFDALSGIGINSSVASNALTLALKQGDGTTDPTSGSPIKVGFRNTNTATNGYNQRSVTAATSITVPSGATLGHVSGAPRFVYLYALDNAGTVELAVSGVQLFDEAKLQSTTAITSAATSGSVLYSTSARTGVPIRFLGRFASNQVAAGTWAAAMTDASLAYGTAVSINLAPTIQKFTSGSGTYTTPTSPAPLYIHVRMVGGGGGGRGSGSGAQGSGGNGGDTTFGSSFLTASGGAGYSGGATGLGGAATINAGATGLAITGATGQGGQITGASSGSSALGGMGGVSPLGGMGQSLVNATASASAANSGSGGPGGGVTGTALAMTAGGGGGSGGYIDAIVTSPASSYAYAVGAAGTAGTLGTTGFAGGAGGSGVIEVTEFYQ